MADDAVTALRDAFRPWKGEIDEHDASTFLEALADRGYALTKELRERWEDLQLSLLTPVRSGPEWQRVLEVRQSVITAILADLAAQGLRVVPAEPTPAMQKAGWDAYRQPGGTSHLHIYAAMIAATTEPGSK